MRRTPLMGVESDKVPLSITLEYDRALLTGIMLTSLFSILNGTELFLISFLFVKSLDIFEILRNKSQRKIQGIPVKQVKLLRSTCAQRRYATMYKEYQGTTKKKRRKPSVAREKTIRLDRQLANSKPQSQPSFPNYNAKTLIS